MEILKQKRLIQIWNKIFLMLSVIAISLDPLFFYIPMIDQEKKCIKWDEKLTTSALILRSLMDIVYIIDIICNIAKAYEVLKRQNPSWALWKRGQLVKSALAVAQRLSWSIIIVDFLAILPVPQVTILVFLFEAAGSSSKKWLNAIILFQYLPRIFRIYLSRMELILTEDILTRNVWVKGGLNFFLYILSSHVFGSIWYFYSFQRETSCWQRACGDDISKLCDESGTHICDKTSESRNITHLNLYCPINPPNGTVFDFGIFLGALQSGMLGSYDFHEKFSNCFWWGLRNLSSLGQNLQTSNYTWENYFAISISIIGLLLFLYLIGNLQTYLQLETTRSEELEEKMKLKERDLELWMSHRLLPETLRERIRRYEQYKWQKTRGVDEENLICNLPKDLRRDVRRHLCLALLMRVPMFEIMDEQLLDGILDRLKPVLYTAGSYIDREGEPVVEMHFIMRGSLETVTTDGGRSGFFNRALLKAGDFCGEELLTWALDPHSSSNLPISTRTVETLAEVEAFALKANDLIFVASQFQRLHSKLLVHTFRFHSQQWRTWAACFIQAAWRRYCKRKLEKSLREAENRLQDALANAGGSSPSLGATIYASRFASNTLRAVRRNGARKARVSARFPPMLPQKPAEPDFTLKNNR